MRGGSPPLDDRALIERIASGQHEALSQLYTTYRPRLRRYLWHQLDANAAAVEDALQEVFLAVWRAVGAWAADGQSRPRHARRDAATPRAGG